MSKDRTESFCQSVRSLAEYVAEPITSKRDVAGVIQGFEIAVELGWKSLQDRIADLGFKERGPKPTLSVGVKMGIISAEEADQWDAILTDRNLAAHTYNPDWARELANRISAQHLPILEKLAKALVATDG